MYFFRINQNILRACFLFFSSISLAWEELIEDGENSKEKRKRNLSVSPFLHLLLRQISLIERYKKLAGSLLLGTQIYTFAKTKYLNTLNDNDRYILGNCFVDFVQRRLYLPLRVSKMPHQAPKQDQVELTTHFKCEIK